MYYGVLTLADSFLYATLLECHNNKRCYSSVRMLRALASNISTVAGIVSRIALYLSQPSIQQLTGRNCAQNVKETAHLLVASRSKMGGDLLRRPLYPFMTYQ